MQGNSSIVQDKQSGKIQESKKAKVLSFGSKHQGFVQQRGIAQHLARTARSHRWSTSIAEETLRSTGEGRDETLLSFEFEVFRTNLRILKNRSG